MAGLILIFVIAHNTFTFFVMCFFLTIFLLLCVCTKHDIALQLIFFHFIVLIAH